MAKSDVLFISDTHFPYQHSDVFSFLEALRDEIKPGRVVHVGDLVDSHAISAHPPSPDGLSSGDELTLDQIQCQKLESIFPKLDVVWGNHDLRPWKRAFLSGISEKYMRGPNEVFKVGKGWKWHNELPMPGNLYVVHGEGGSAFNVAQTTGCNVVQGHRHNEFYIEYMQTPTQLVWGMQIGFLGNDKSLAMAYGRTSIKKGVLGTGAIVNGEPRLFRMKLDKHGRWTGKL